MTAVRVETELKSLLLLIVLTTQIGQLQDSDCPPRFRSLLENSNSAAFELCIVWTRALGRGESGPKAVLDSLDAHGTVAPYQWRAAFRRYGKLNLNRQVSGGGLRAPVTLQILRDGEDDHVGHIVLLEKTIAIPISGSGYPGTQWRTSEAALHDNSIYLVENVPGAVCISRISVSTEKTEWTTKVPFAYSEAEAHSGGPGFGDPAQELTFHNDQDVSSVGLWHHFAGEFVFVELDRGTGELSRWFSSESSQLPWLPRITRTKR